MTYEELHNGLQELDKETNKELIAMCQKNLWLKDGGVYFEDDPFLELDSPFGFSKTDDLEFLKEFFDHGNWSIRQGIVYEDLAFINQINGGDEWWTLKKFDGKWLPFESITWCAFIRDGQFEKLMGRLLNATYDQCKHLEY